MDDDEHVLRGILERGVGDAERAQDAPHEREVRRVDSRRRTARSTSAIQRVRHGGHSSVGVRTAAESVTEKPLHASPSSRPHVARADIGDGA